jgi:hypothetical protein
VRSGVWFWGSKLRAWGVGCRVKSTWSRVQGEGRRVLELGIWVHSLGRPRVYLRSVRF